MFSLVKQSDNYKYNLQRFICDTTEDLPSAAPHGSTALVLDTSKYYLLAATGWEPFGGADTPAQEYAKVGSAKTDQSKIQ